MKAIVQDGDPILRKIAKAVPENLFGTKGLQKLVDDMSEMLDVEPDGVAIAAPQIGSSLRLFVVRTDRILPPPPEGAPAHPAHIEVYANPEIIRRSRKKQESDEGCLSVRGVYGKTKRHERATIRARRVDGTKFERGAGGVMAQIFEHEMDHLNGILFIDHAFDMIELKHTDTHESD